MNSPTVSVVIPSFNRPKLLRRAVESVLEQTYEDLEIIVVDDGSDIPAREVLSDSPSAVEVLTHEKNRGGSVARNTGIRNSRGKYIAFLDDDDHWERTKIEKQVKKFDRSNSNVGLVYSWIRRIDTEGQTILLKDSKHSGNVDKHILLENFVGSYSCVMVKKNAIGNAGLPDTRFDRWQDREWYFRLSRVCEFEYIPEFLVIQEKQGGVHFSEVKKSMSLFLNKYSDHLNNLDNVFRRKVLSNLFFEVGSAGIRAGEFREARNILLKSICYYPINHRAFLFLLLSLSNDRVMNVARRVKRSANNYKLQ